MVYVKPSVTAVDQRLDGGRPDRAQLSGQMMKRESATAYRHLVRAMVRGDRRSRIAQRVEETRKQIALLTYRRMTVVRQQNETKDALLSAKLFKELQSLNRQVDALKRERVENDKTLLFARDTALIRESLSENEGDAGRLLQHLHDMGSFLTNQREYDELIERYNGSSKLTQEETVKRTAGRVGLDIPF